MEPSSAPWRVVEPDRRAAPAGATAPGHDLPWVAIGAVLIALVVAGSAILLAARPDPGIEVDGAVTWRSGSPPRGEPGRRVRRPPRERSSSRSAARSSDPGVYRLPAGARVLDAVDAAGGFGPRVDAAEADRRLNLAAPVRDGDEIHVPARGEVAAASPGVGGRRRRRAVPIDLNQATAERSTRCPGSARRPPPRSSPRARSSPSRRSRSSGRARSSDPRRSRRSGTWSRSGRESRALPRTAWAAVGVAFGAAWAAAGMPVVATTSRGLVADRRRRSSPDRRLARVRLPLVGGRRRGGAGGDPASSSGRRRPSLRRSPRTADRGPPIVESVGSPRDGDQVARLRLADAGGSVLVAATLPAYPAVTAGATVEVGGRLRPPPDDDPYGDVPATHRRVGHARRARAAGHRDAGPRRSRPPRDAARRRAPPRRCRSPRPGSPPGSSSGCASASIGRSPRTSRRPASSHVVAISGWNIAIVAGLVGAVLRGRHRRVVSVAVLGTVVAYVVAAGGSPSVVRAAVMAGVVLLARESGRAGRAAAALGRRPCCCCSSTRR